MQILLVIHNLIRWLIILFGLWAVINAASGLAAKREFMQRDRRSNFLFVLWMDLQFLAGLALYFVGDWVERLKHLSDNMKDTNTRFFTIEHEVMMIIALILVHIGSVKVKRTNISSLKFKRSFIFFIIALLLILIATPWPFRDAVARPWFRWF